MSKNLILNPAACTARIIENFYIQRENNHSFILRRCAGIVARTLSVTAFPFMLTIELIFLKIPKALDSVTFSQNQIKKIKFKHKIDKVTKHFLGIIFSPLGFVHTPDVVSCFFLKTLSTKPTVRPFGVENIYGKEVEAIYFPTNKEELRELILLAKKENKQVSVIGAGMCQGEQTVPASKNHLVINMQNFKALSFNENHEMLTAQAGANWEEIQFAVKQKNKCINVKQASNAFSVGGSIGINCHGWSHNYGAIASTVEQIEVMNAKGEIQILKSSDPEFGYFFGTLGYFGIVISATFKLVDDEMLKEKTTVVDLDHCIDLYEEKIKNNENIPLFGGRLVLDSKKGAPLRKVYMVTYEKESSAPESSKHSSYVFVPEEPYGTRFQRIALQAIAHLSSISARIFVSNFWKSEKKNMLLEKKLTRHEALHPPINAFQMLHHSNLHAQWLQEYFIKKENLPNFLRYLGEVLRANNVRLINATIRPTPKDNISLLPYAEQDRYAVVLSFSQFKSKKELARTQKWIENVLKFVIAQGDVYYQAYMPFATQKQFEKSYGEERVANLRKIKSQYDPENRFGNAHTVKYFDAN